MKVICKGYDKCKTPCIHSEPHDIIEPINVGNVYELYCWQHSFTDIKMHNCQCSSTNLRKYKLNTLRRLNNI